MIDLRSDTVTKPTEAMRRAMAEAEVGDDVYGEDPTVNKLEEAAAQIMGKEAALFVPTGTMGNLIAAVTHCQRGQEIILGDESHIYYYEVGGAAVVGGLVYHTLPGDRFGQLDPAQVEHALRPANIHFAAPGLLCLENTHNRGGGTVMTVEHTNALCEVAHQHNIPAHLDGARIFNAAVYLGQPVADLVRELDSVQFCLSKGLGAPVGSVLAGKRDFIERARKTRKLLGGGMRQAGVLAAAGLIALLEMPHRLEEDHLNARRLAEGINLIPGLSVDMATVQTNIVCVDITPESYPADQWVQLLKAEGVLINAIGPRRLRFVTHLDISRRDIEATLTILSRKG